MKYFTLVCAAALASGVAAQSTSAPANAVSTTITAHAGCPTPAADVMVTRSDVAVPSCAAGSNATKPSIVSMSGSGSGSGTSTGTGAAAQFTGAAGRNGVSAVLVVVGGAAAYFL